MPRSKLKEDIRRLIESGIKIEPDPPDPEQAMIDKAVSEHIADNVGDSYFPEAAHRDLWRNVRYVFRCGKIRDAGIRLYESDDQKLWEFLGDAFRNFLPRSFSGNAMVMEPDEVGEFVKAQAQHLRSDYKEIVSHIATDWRFRNALLVLYFLKPKAVKCSRDANRRIPIFAALDTLFSNWDSQDEAYRRITDVLRFRRTELKGLVGAQLRQKVCQLAGVKVAPGEIVAIDKFISRTLEKILATS
jgi:hypothetical protein